MYPLPPAKLTKHTATAISTQDDKYRPDCGFCGWYGDAFDDLSAALEVAEEHNRVENSKL